MMTRTRALFGLVTRTMMTSDRCILVESHVELIRPARQL